MGAVCQLPALPYPALALNSSAAIRFLSAEMQSASVTCGPGSPRAPEVHGQMSSLRCRWFDADLAFRSPYLAGGSSAIYIAALDPKMLRVHSHARQ
jgi:hypothetical protein